jgi:hypothetical protein
LDVLFCLLLCAQALTSNSQRLQLLQQLFTDIALKVDDNARGATISLSCF